MAFVFSPSNMSTFQDCPRKFQAQSLTKEITWKASASKSRGTLIHNNIERAIKEGMQSIKSWPEGVDESYIRQQVEESRRKILTGGSIHVEHELCINSKFRKVDWWDEDALLRARADTLILPSDKISPAIVIDFKTGKKWDVKDFQLRVECLLTHLIYNKPIVDYAYWYVDAGETVDGSIDFRNGLAPVQDIIDLLKDMKLSIRDNDFPSKENKFCKWCGLYQKPACNRFKK